MSSVLNSVILQKRAEGAAILGQIDGIIIDRIDYILNTIYSAFNTSFDSWYIDGAGEGELGDLGKVLNTNNINLMMSGPHLIFGTKFIIIDKYGDELKYLDSSFPKRWLFESFEEELNNGIALFKQKQKDNKIKEIESRKNKKEVRERALSKLTEEEKKALKLS